ncbi:MAG: PAS domain-containing sensor histidine kinase [Bacteroidota bacterium]
MRSNKFIFSEGQFHRLFPYYILLDKDLIVISHGNTISNYCNIQNGQKLSSCFQIYKPDITKYKISELNGISSRLISMGQENESTSFVLEGVWEYISATEELLFVGFPPNQKEPHRLNYQIKEQKDLGEKIKFLNELIENFNSAVLCEDPERKILYVNNKFCSIFEIPVSAEDLIGIDCSLVAQNGKRRFKDPLSFIERVEQLVASRISASNDIVYLADGSILERDYIPININGEFVAHLWKYTDVTDRITLENKLKSSEKLLQTLFNNFRSSLMYEDINNTIVFVNQAFCNIISPELVPSFLIGKKTTESIHSIKHLFKEPELFVRRVNELIAKNESEFNEFVEMADGRILKRYFVPITVGNIRSGYIWRYEDITEHLAFEKQLKEQKEYFYRILNELPVDIMIFSLDHKFEFVNKSAVKNDEMRAWLIGKNMYDYCKHKNIGPELAIKREKLFKEALERNKANSTIDEHIKPDGSIQYMLRFHYPFSNEDGKVEFVVGFGVDITEQKNSERKFIEQGEYYNEILNEVPADIVIFSLDHKYRFINKNAIKNKEIREWLIGKDDYDYCRFKQISTKMADERRKMFNDAVIMKKPMSLIDEIVNENQTTKYILRIMYPSIDANGSVKYVIGYGIDITEQLQLERKATLNEKRMNKLLDIIRDGVFRLNTDGWVVYNNNSFSFIMGIEPLMEQGHQKPIRFQDYLSTEEWKKLSDKIQALKNTGQPQLGIMQIINKLGVEKYLDYSITDSINDPDALCTFRISDITEIVNKERNLEEIIKKEKELNNSKSQFVRITSHELRTPLAIIQANVEILEMIQGSHFETGNSPNPEVMTSRIVKEVKVMTEILNELMMISKIEKGEIDFNPSDIDIHTFINTISQDLYTPYADGRSLQVEIDKKISQICLDKKLMRHALVNIITNAFKYSAGKLAPTLRIKNEYNSILFEIEDHGIGIPEEDQNKLFTSFFRASNVGAIQGTGLGLMVLDYAVKRHGGTIDIKSEIDKGSTVSVKIPIIKAQ